MVSSHLPALPAGGRTLLRVTGPVLRMTDQVCWTQSGPRPTSPQLLFPSSGASLSLAPLSIHRILISKYFKSQANAPSSRKHAQLSCTKLLSSDHITLSLPPSQALFTCVAAELFVHPTAAWAFEGATQCLSFPVPATTPDPTPSSY